MKKFHLFLLLLLPISAVSQDYVAKDWFGVRVECGEQKIDVNITPNKVVVKGETVSVNLTVVSDDTVVGDHTVWVGVDKDGNKFYLRGWLENDDYGFKIEPVVENLVPVITVHPTNICK
jgi:hypothetical protein